MSEKLIQNNVDETSTLLVKSDSFELDVQKEKKKTKIVNILAKVLIYAFLTIFAVFSFFPFYYMFISSIMTEGEFRGEEIHFFPTEGIRFKNYAAVLAYPGKGQGSYFVQNIINTLVVGSLSTFLGVVVIIITAYAFARLEFKGKNILFSLMLATMMIPGELFTITNYITVTKANWLDTFVVLIVPFLVSFYYIFLLRNSFKQIPDSLYKAAKVDGTSEIGYLIKVMVPLTAPTLISVSLLKFIGIWNSYMWPSLVNKSSEWQLISNWVTEGFTDVTAGFGNTALDTLKMAAACMVALPLFVLFVCFRKYIMHGVSKSGIKG